MTTSTSSEFCFYFSSTYTKFSLSYIFLFSAIVMIATKARHSMLKIHVAVEVVVARVRRSFKV